MATFQDLLKTLGGAALQGGQKAVKSAQDAIVNWAAKNPTQAGNILKATGGSFGAMVQKSPIQVAKALAPTVTSIAKQAVAPKVAVKPPPVVQKTTAKTTVKPVVQQKGGFGKLIIQPVKPTTPITQTGGGPSRAMVLAGAGGTQPSTMRVKASDINPQTGLPYAINPATGLWDDAYFQRTWGGGVGAAGIPPNVLATIRKYAQSGVSQAEAERLAMEELRPYYEQKLKDSNWDYETAQKQMFADRDLQLKQERESAGATAEAFVGVTAPEEQKQLKDELARRGLLTTPEGTATPLSADIAGKTITAPDVFKRGYGGIAGGRISTLLTGQKARAEAIARALGQREESLGLATTQKQELMTEEQKRAQRLLEETKRKEAASLATSKYQRGLEEARMKTAEALSPYST